MQSNSNLSVGDPISTQTLYGYMDANSWRHENLIRGVVQSSPSVHLKTILILFILKCVL